MLADLQAGRCFYCHKDMKTSDVDHFIPWSRYPVDLGHNFVLAHGPCNSAKGAMLAAEEHLARWVERNSDHGEEIARECDRARVAHDLNASMQVAHWAYGQAASAGASAWLRGNMHRDCPPIGRGHYRSLRPPRSCTAPHEVRCVLCLMLDACEPSSASNSMLQ